MRYLTSLHLRNAMEHIKIDMGQMSARRVGEVEHDGYRKMKQCRKFSRIEDFLMGTYPHQCSVDSLKNFTHPKEPHHDISGSPKHLLDYHVVLPVVERVSRGFKNVHLDKCIEVMNEDGKAPTSG